MAKTILVVLAPYLLTSSIAGAEPDGRATRKEPWKALALSLGTTVAGIGLVAWSVEIGIEPWNYVPPPSSRAVPLQVGLASVGGAAVLAAPSLGRLHGHAPLWNLGTALRISGLAAGAIGLAINTTARDDLSMIYPVIGLVSVGATAFLVGTAYEIATTPRDVRRYNRAHGLDVTLTVTALRTRDGSVVPGLAIAGRF
jgi:hypothetical protein